MSPQSVFLKSLLERKEIGSLSWGYDQGSTGDSPLGAERVDGLMTLGGYDKARFEGEAFYQALDQRDDVLKVCQVTVDVVSMTLNDEAGSRDLGGKPFK